MNGWGLTTAAATVLALAISLGRGEIPICKSPDMPRVVTRHYCHPVGKTAVCEPRAFVVCEPPR